MKKAKVAIARKIAVILHCIGSTALRSSGVSRRQPVFRRKFLTRFSGRRCPAGTVVVTTSFNRLVAVRPHTAGHVEASDPDIIMRRLATSERTMTPAMASRNELDTSPQFKGPIDMNILLAAKQTLSCELKRVEGDYHSVLTNTHIGYIL